MSADANTIPEVDAKGLELLLEHGLLSLANAGNENEAFLNAQSQLGVLPLEAPPQSDQAVVVAQQEKPPNLVSTWGRQHPSVRFHDNTNAVTTLDLGGKRLHKGFPCSIPETIGAFCHLTTLNLAGTDVPLHDILEILALPRVQQNLECLYLGGNGLGDEGATAVATQFLRSAQTLRKLDLRYDDIRAGGMRSIC